MSRPLRIAVADDEPDIRDFLAALLTRLGHRVVVARTGRELVELCRATEPDLVITDQRMPELGGAAAAAEVCRARPVPVILISGEDEWPEGPFAARLRKPVSAAEVEAAVARACPAP